MKLDKYRLMDEARTPLWVFQIKQQETNESIILVACRSFMYIKLSESGETNAYRTYIRDIDHIIILSALNVKALVIIAYHESLI